MQHLHRNTNDIRLPQRATDKTQGAIATQQATATQQAIATKQTNEQISAKSTSWRHSGRGSRYSSFNCVSLFKNVLYSSARRLFPNIRHSCRALLSLSTTVLQTHRSANTKLNCAITSFTYSLSRSFSQNAWWRYT